MTSKKHRQATESPRQAISNSFLVRVWQEPGGKADLRFYLRDLKTGEERYLSDAGRIGELLSRGLGGETRLETRNEETA